MEDDPFLGRDEDNQDGNFNEINSAEESAGLGDVGPIYGLSEVLNEAIPQASDRSPRSMEFLAHKVHSAASTSTGFGLDGGYEDVPRPYTSAGLDDSPSRSSLVTRHCKKKTSAVRKKTARDGETPRKERPRSAGLNEWGDFDTDHLLREDFEPSGEQSNQTPDTLRSRSRKSRRATPTTSSPRPNPWEGYICLNGESKESSKPPMQVLRQKPIEILNLDLGTQTNQPSGRAGATPKPLLGRESLERLIPSHSRPATSDDSFRPTTSTSLFGTEILDTPKNRAAIFARFAYLWSLIPHHSTDQPESSDILPDPQSRSAFECNMTMVKICKTVGISLTPSAGTRLSFTHENDVDFESFCDLVIQVAVQPALHHFNLDNSVEEYGSALETIVQSLVTTAPARRRGKDMLDPSDFPSRVKELNEIQPVFLSWKAGVTPRLMQPTEDPDPPPTRTLVTAENVRRALEASVSQRMLAHQLPSEEARVTHVENIRRKVQLHNSWKFSSADSVGEGAINSQKTPMSRGNLTSSHEKRSTATRPAELFTMFEHSVSSTTAGVVSDEVLPQEEGDRPELVVDTIDVESENDEVLVCCSCSARVAVLWCSSCFTVNCQKCWQEVHSCIVDTSMVSSKSSTTKKPLLGPTTFGIQKKRGNSVKLRPPVAMIYLPTKAIVSGKLARGAPIVRHSRKSSNQVNSGATKDESPVVVVSAILPSLHKSCSDSKIPRHFERPQVEKAPAAPKTESTTPTSGSRSTVRLHAHIRGKFHLAPVTLDAELLLR